MAKATKNLIASKTIGVVTDNALCEKKSENPKIV